MTTDNDHDLRALREFRAGLDEPRDGALARGRWRLAQSDGPLPAVPGGRRRRQWVLASAGAALSVAAVVGAAALVQTGSPDAAQKQPGAGSSPSVTDLPVTAGTKAPLNPAIADPGGATHAKAIAALGRLATAGAGARPMTIQPGQVLYVKTYNLVQGQQAYVHEVWQDVDAGAALRIRRTDGGVTNIDTSMTQVEIDKARAEPPSLWHPNTAYYTGLPTDPDQLFAQWQAWAEVKHPGGDGQLMFKELYDFLHYTGPLWSPALRTAVFGALAKLPDLRGNTIRIDDYQYELLCMPMDQAGSCVLFDAQTGLLAGDAWTGADLVVKADGLTFVDLAVLPRPPVGTGQPPGSPKEPTASVPPNKVKATG